MNFGLKQKSREPPVKERPGTYHSYEQLLRERPETSVQALPSVPLPALPAVDLNNPYPPQYITPITDRRSDGSGYEVPVNYSTSSGYEVPVNYSTSSGYEVPIGYMMQERIYEEIDDFAEDYEDVEETQQ